MNEEPAVLGIAVYRKKDWEKLLQISDDMENLEPTWKEWHKNLKNFMVSVKKENKNISFKKITINLDDLIEYCIKNKLKINSKNRSKYTTHLMRKTFKDDTD